MSQPKLTQSEIRFLQEAINSDYVNGSLRLREGEYQYILAKAIASFQLELYFPDVKDIIRRLYDEEKTNDIQFIRKIQTILKKMEKSHIVKILPKKKPWELQRYTLSSMKFMDSDKNPVVFATEQEIEQTRNLLGFYLDQKRTPNTLVQNVRFVSFILVFTAVASYAIIVWDFMRPLVDPIIFIVFFPIAVACSIVLGKILSRV